MTDVLINGPEDAKETLILTPGASGGMRQKFLSDVAKGVGESGIRVVRFEFEYTRAGRKRPDPAPKLLDEWRAVVGEYGDGIYIGGKSMGGRMASMVADESHIRGLVCLGYPFHPPGQPEKLRTAHLEGLKTPALIVQGTRDQFGSREEVTTYTLSRKIRLEWIDGADHSFRNRDHVVKSVAAIVRFITS